MKYIIAGFAAFVYVGLRAFQQRNIALDKDWAVPPTSYAMAGMDLLLVSFMASEGWTAPMWIALGTGGSLGSLCAMRLHRLMR